MIRATGKIGQAVQTKTSLERQGEELSGELAEPRDAGRIRQLGLLTPGGAQIGAVALVQ